MIICHYHILVHINVKRVACRVVGFSYSQPSTRTGYNWEVSCIPRRIVSSVPYIKGLTLRSVHRAMYICAWPAMQAAADLQRAPNPSSVSNGLPKQKPPQRLLARP